MRIQRIGKISDCIVIIEHQRDAVGDDGVNLEIRQMMGGHKSFAPLGTLFETTSIDLCRCSNLTVNGDYPDR